jgi:hypothetical protein
MQDDRRGSGMQAPAINIPISVLNSSPHVQPPQHVDGRRRSPLKLPPPAAAAIIHQRIHHHPQFVGFLLFISNLST